MANNAVVIAAILMLVLMFLRAPVFTAVLAGGAVYFLLNPSVPAMIYAQRITAGTESVALLAIPFFVCAGVLMNYTGVTDRIMRFCTVLTGRMPGGLGHVNVLLSTLMGGLSGSNMADAAMEAKMLVPAMEKQGYSRAFSTVLTAVTSIIVPLIPPGIAMIIYGTISGVSIGRLFIAGAGPGIILCIALLFLVSYVAKKNHYEASRTEKLTLREFFIALKGAILPLCLPVVIIGGIRLGIFTPTEAGAVAIVYALLLGAIDRKLTLENLWLALKETVTITASIMVIIGAASVFSWFLTKEMVPQQITNFIVSMISNKWLFMIAVVLFLTIVGMFIEGNAAMIVLVPLLAPVASAYGINEIHFAIVFIFTMILGGITPPMGTLMFLTCGITGVKVQDFLKECIPFYALLYGCLLILIFCPAVTAGLANLVWG